jgi:hypothetical protein
MQNKSIITTASTQKKKEQFPIPEQEQYALLTKGTAT